MYEKKTDRLLTHRQFRSRVIQHAMVAFGALAIALGIGVVGYRILAHLSWIDSLLNASMILGGMGPVDRLATAGAKFFASMYALFAGLVFVGALGLLFAPFLHRIMHKLHMEDAG